MTARLCQIGIVIWMMCGAAVAQTASHESLLPGSVVIDGISYGMAPSEPAFSLRLNEYLDFPKGTSVDPVFQQKLSKFGHFYCSHKPVLTPLPAGVHLPPPADPVEARRETNILDEEISSRVQETMAAWEAEGARWANGDQVTAADVTGTIAEQTLCPDGIKNVYAGLNFPP